MTAIHWKSGDSAMYFSPRDGWRKIYILGIGHTGEFATAVDTPHSRRGFQVRLSHLRRPPSDGNVPELSRPLSVAPEAISTGETADENRPPTVSPPSPNAELSFKK